MKQCPLRKTDIDINDEPVHADCVEKACAWWLEYSLTEGECAMLSIGYSLKNMDEAQFNSPVKRG